jgi:outer membrane receptor protein involved in Fe transport
LPATIDRANASTSLHFSGVEGWDFAVNGQASREKIGFGIVHFPTGASAPAGTSQVQELVQNQWIAGLSANGKLGDPAANVGLAFGALHREESYARDLVRPRMQGQDASRTVDAGYLELHVPMFGAVKGVPGAKQMNVSLAGRYEKYSDVGEIANPRFGVSWTPIAGLEIRSTYSTSFRAPAVGSELLGTSRGTSPQVFIYSFKNEDGSETIPVAFRTGSKELRPERARNWTAGISVRPARIEGLQLDLTYYDIVYSDRIIAPPLDQNALSNPAVQSFLRRYDNAGELQADIEQQTRGGVEYVDRTGSNFGGGAFGANPQNLATYSYDARLTNAGIVKTRGSDLAVKYSTRLMAGELGLALHANYIAQMDTSLAPGAPAMDLVGTTASPAGLRLRTIAAYSRQGWDAALAVNYTNGYSDTFPSVDARVGSYTTADATLSYTFPSGREGPTDNLSIRLGVTNLFNQTPPHIRGSLATRGANYDAVNADPLGRLIAVDVTKKW